MVSVGFPCHPLGLYQAAMAPRKMDRVFTIARQDIFGSGADMVHKDSAKAMHVINHACDEHYFCRMRNVDV